jgi:hypothetical protein
MKKLAETSPEQWLLGIERALGSPVERAGDTDEDAAAEDGEHWPELERLARGELGASRLRELEIQSETDPELKKALEAFRPLDARLVDHIGERVSSLGAPARSSSPASSRVRARPARARARLIWGGAPVLAAAAALLLWFSAPAVVPLGEYRVEVAGALAESRGDVPAGEAPHEAGQGEAPSLRVLPGARLDVVVRPAVADSAVVDAHVFLERAGERRSVAATIARSESGAVRLSLQLPASDVGADQGGELVVIVSRPGRALPTVAEARKERGLGWQRFRFVLVNASVGP